VWLYIKLVLEQILYCLNYQKSAEKTKLFKIVQFYAVNTPAEREMGVGIAYIGTVQKIY
jgi:hypothetical protein